MTIKTVEEQVAEVKAEIMYCEHDPIRGVLTSNPAQYQCMRERCYQTWVVGTKPPVCKMFDVEKYTEN